MLCKFGAQAVKPKPSSVPAFAVTIRTQQLHRRRHQAARIPSCGKDGTPVRAHFAKTFPATARQDPPLRLKSGPCCASEKQTHPRAHEPPCGRSCVLYRARPVATRWRRYAVYTHQLLFYASGESTKNRTRNKRSLYRYALSSTIVGQ